MGVLTIAAVRATYVLMNRDATNDRVEELTVGAVQEGAQLVVFPEVFVPGTPIWIDTRPIWTATMNGSPCSTALSVNLE